jgi:hypothetical protein
MQSNWRNKTIIAVRLETSASFNDPSQFFNPDYQGHGGEKSNGYKARRLQVPTLRQDFLREERA